MDLLSSPLGLSFRLACFCGVLAALVLDLRALTQLSRSQARLDLSSYLFAPFADPGLPTATFDYAQVEGRRLRLDLWAPREPATVPRRAIVRVHGGSWAFGERSESPHWCRFLVEQDCVVFDVDYRLTPPPRWRDAVGDVRGAVRWVRANALRFGVDPERIVLMGASAGGHLALCAAYGDDATFPPSPLLGPASGNGSGSDTPGVQVAGVIAISPPVVLEIGFGADYPWWYPDDLRSTRRVEEFVGGDPTSVPERYRLASPLEQVSRGAPATLLLHGATDRLVWPENCELLAARLKEFGVEHELVLIEGSDHLFEYRAGGWATQRARFEIAAFLARR